MYLTKPVDTKTKFVKQSERDRYIHNRYGYIKELVGNDYSNMFIAKEIKSYSKHHSFCTFGVNVLSMSKRIMSEVMTSAEDLSIPMFYTDTDSMFLRKSDVGTLATAFENVYNRELIGTQLGQFHSDLEGDAVSGIFVMKKCYVVQLDDGCLHVRMKGIPTDVLVNTANSMFTGSKCYIEGKTVRSSSYNNTVINLFNALYRGESIEFDLVNSSTPRYETTIGRVTTKLAFKRRVVDSNAHTGGDLHITR